MPEIKKTNQRFSGMSWPPPFIPLNPAPPRSGSKSQMNEAGGRLSGNGAVSWAMSGKFCRSAALTCSACYRRK